MDMDLVSIVFLEITFLELFVGLFSNVLIVCISSRSWRNGGCLSPGDTILMVLGLCNVVLQTSLICGIIIYYFWLQVFLSYTFFCYYFAVYNSMCLCSSWMTSWLCAFYCIKITTFRSNILLLLKSRFSDFLPWLMLVSVASSVILASSGFLTALNTTANNTKSEGGQHIPFTVSVECLGALLLWCCVPCLLIIISLALTLTSLVIHAWTMKASHNFHRSQIKAHISGIRTMTSLLVLYIIFYLTQVLLALNSFPLSSPWFRIFLLLHFSFCTLEGVILISGNPKLYNAVRSLYSHLKTDRENPSNDAHPSVMTIPQ